MMTVIAMLGVAGLGLTASGCGGDGQAQQAPIQPARKGALQQAVERTHRRAKQLEKAIQQERQATRRATR